jgi:hypothetical protein
MKRKVLISGLMLLVMFGFIGCDDKKENEENEGRIIAEQYRGDYQIGIRRDRFTLTKNKLIYYGDFTNSYESENWFAWTDGNNLWALIEECWFDKDKSSSRVKVQHNVGVLTDTTFDSNLFDNYHGLWTKLPK